MGLNSLILILLTFRAYLRITKILLPSPDIYKRVEVVRRVMRKIKKIHAKNQIATALATRNGPNTALTIRLLL